LKEKLKYCCLFLFVLVICLFLLTRPKSVVASPASQDTCQAAPATHFLYLPWDTNSGGDWHNKMTSVFDHDSPNYACSTGQCNRSMKIDVWTGEEARPKVATGGDGYGYCFGANNSYGKCQTPAGTKVQGVGSILGYVAVTDEYSQLFYDGHDGYDWALAGGSSEKILAAASGRVVYAQKNPWLGWTIKIDHLNGYSTSYSHLKSGSFQVQMGSCVIAGQHLAYQGNSTGNYDVDPKMGIHLHFKTFLFGDVSNPNDRSVTDPMGWCADCSNAPPDPLIQFNGLSSSNLWDSGVPHSVGRAPTRNSLAITWGSLDTTYMGGDGTLVDFGGSPTPVPTVTPGGPTVTPTAPPTGNGTWTVKAFSSINECNDSPNCNPTSVFYQTTVSGTNFNLNFSDGKAFGNGGDQWGTFFKQTVNLSPGTYYIHADHDDGVKVWVNGSSKMDVLNSSENNTTCPGIYLSGQTSLSILWKNTGGQAHLNFSIDQNGAPCQPQQKWHVWYYHDPNLCSGPNCSLSQVYCETDIAGTWFHIDPYQGGTACGDSDQTWGSVWKQTINFPEGDYVFYSDHDDGVKIFLGDSNIMDVWSSESGNKACPARHLSGDVPVTIIHNNTGGDARINIWWDTNSSNCEQVAYNVWVWKDAGDMTHVTVNNGDINKVNLYLARSGQPMEVTRTRWFAVGNGIEALIPADVDSFLVDQGFVPTIDSSNADEWYTDAGDPHWVVRKKLSVWSDEQGQVRLTYKGDHTRPQIRYYVSGNNQELYVSDLWYELSDGSGIEAIIPDTYEAMKVDRWIKPVVETYATSMWFENNYWLTKKIVSVIILPSDQTKITYYWGSPLPVSLGRYGQELEIRTDLWQSEEVDGHTNYFMILPADVVAFQIEGGPKPQIDNWASWYWGNYSGGRWVSEKTVWIYKNAGNDTQVYYANPNVDPADVPVIYYLYNDSAEHQTTAWWTKSGDGLMLTIPRNVDSFVLTRGPAPLITDQATPEWRVISVDGRWINRKPIRVWLDSWGKTYVTYWHETVKPNLHYVLNGTEVTTTSLWVTAGDGLQARIPDGATHFLVEVNNQPYIETSAANVWKFSALPGLWLEQLNVPTPTPVVTATPTITATFTPTATPTVAKTVITVKARATTADTKMRLSIGTRYVKTIIVGTVSKTYSFTVPFTVTTTDRIRISLVNGSRVVTAPTRKLQIVSITFNGVTRYTKTLVKMNIFSVGAKKGVNACQSLSTPLQLIGTQATNWLFCTGYFEFR